MKLGVYFRGRSKERGRLLEDLLYHYCMTLAYDTASPVPKQSCLKKLNTVPFVLMINDKSVIECYLLQ